MDTHEGVFSPQHHNRRIHHHQHEDEDVNVRNIAQFWEKQLTSAELEEERKRREFAEQSKRWASMPDLKTKINRAKAKKKKKRKEEQLEHPQQQQQQHNNEQEDEEYERLRRERIRAEARRRIDLVRSGRQSPDDRGVCTGVLADRKRLFEDMARKDMRMKQRQWASMPSLDKKSSERKSSSTEKDRYFPYQSQYGRQGSQVALNHSYDPTKTPFSKVR